MDKTYTIKDSKGFGKYTKHILIPKSMQGNKFIVICYKYFPLIKHILDVIEPQQTLPEILTKPELKLLRKLLLNIELKDGLYSGYTKRAIECYIRNLKYISEPTELKNIAWLIKDQNKEIYEKIMKRIIL